MGCHPESLFDLLDRRFDSRSIIGANRAADIFAECSTGKRDKDLEPLFYQYRNIVGAKYALILIDKQPHRTPVKGLLISLRLTQELRIY